MHTFLVTPTDTEQQQPVKIPYIPHILRAIVSKVVVLSQSLSDKLDHVTLFGSQLIDPIVTPIRTTALLLLGISKHSGTFSKGVNPLCIDTFCQLILDGQKFFFLDSQAPVDDRENVLLFPLLAL